jgi:ParB family chromosome partitioning protein
MSEGKFEILDIASIQIPDGFNPRTPTANDENLLSLEQSIEQIGQLAPVLVNHKEGKYWLIAGQRRIEAAAKSRGVTTIEAKVFENLDITTMLRMTLAENRHRKELNAIEEARGMEMLVEINFTDEQISKEFNYTVDTVRRRLNLLKLPEDIKQMITRQTNPLPVHQAYLLYGLPKDIQRAAAHQIAPTTKPPATEQRAKEIIDELKGGKLPISQPDEEDRHPSVAIAKRAKGAPQIPSRSEKKFKSENFKGAGVGQRPTKDQKNSMPKGAKGSSEDDNIKLGGVELNIDGIATLSKDGRNITFRDAAAFLTIGSTANKNKKEIIISEPMVVFFTNECPGVIKKIQAAIKAKAETKK